MSDVQILKLSSNFPSATSCLPSLPMVLPKNSCLHWGLSLPHLLLVLLSQGVPHSWAFHHYHVFHGACECQLFCFKCTLKKKKIKSKLQTVSNALGKLVHMCLNPVHLISSWNVLHAVCMYRTMCMRTSTQVNLNYQQTITFLLKLMKPDATQTQQQQRNYVGLLKQITKNKSNYVVLSVYTIITGGIEL